MYIIKSLLRHTEIDNYNEGCEPDSFNTILVDVTFKADTLEELIANVCEFIGTDCYEIDPCGDEPNRIDWQLHEVEGQYTVPATDRHLELWREGKQDLVLSDYSAIVEFMTTSDVDIENILKSEV